MGNAKSCFIRQLLVERHTGLEPVPFAWKANMLPLNTNAAQPETLPLSYTR